MIVFQSHTPVELFFLLQVFRCFHTGIAAGPDSETHLAAEKAVSAVDPTGAHYAGGVQTGNKATIRLHDMLVIINFQSAEADIDTGKAEDYIVGRRLDRSQVLRVLQTEKS